MTFKDKIKGCGIDVETLKGATFMITGATGLIGKILATELLTLSNEDDLDIKVILPVRNKARLSGYLLEQEECGNVVIIECDISDFDVKILKCDFVVHCASITESKKMIENPVEVIKTNIYGTVNMLEFARQNSVKAFVYLSSMETYGFTTDKVLLTEDNIQYLNPLEIRSCYPESKRMAENICISYTSEYCVPVRIVRLAQTFGRGVSLNDTRAFADFARRALCKRNIELLTDGSSARMYLDTEDAVVAILTVLLNGKNGEAYNVANKNTYCSIAEMAMSVAENIGNGEIKVNRIISDEKAKQFPPSHKFFLDTSRIEHIGWKPYTDLSGMYYNMIEDWDIQKLHEI